jgi:hypothetical protein
MGKFLAIAHNTFLQTIRQPIYCTLILVMFLVLVLTLPTSGWTLGESGGEHHDTDQKMLEIMGLSTLLVLGSLLSAFSASSALAKEIEDKTALTVISKPVPRSVFVLGKFGGVAAAIGLAYYLGALVFLMTVRHQVVSAVSEPLDWPVIVIGFGALTLALAVALAGNFFFSWPFTSAFVWSATVCLSAAMLVILFVGKDWTLVRPGYDEPVKAYDNIRVVLEKGRDIPAFKAFAAQEAGFTVMRSEDQLRAVYLRPPQRLSVDEAIAVIRAQWKDRGVESAGRQLDPPVIRPALLAGLGLTFLSLLVLVAVAVTASTRLGLVLTLLVCGGVFLVGSSHRYLFLGTRDNVVLYVLAWIAPNLGYFYSVDVLSKPFETGIPASFVAAAALYCAAYVMGVLALGVVLFQGRQMAAEGASASVPGAVSLLAGLGRAAALILGLGGLVLLSVPAMHTAWGMLTIAILLALAVGSWFLWSAFSRGAKWSYWLVVVVACLDLAQRAVSAIAPRSPVAQWRGRGEGPALTVLETILAVAILLILVLPKTRRHFHSQT